MIKGEIKNQYSSEKHVPKASRTPKTVAKKALAKKTAGTKKSAPEKKTASESSTNALVRKSRKRNPNINKYNKDLCSVRTLSASAEAFGLPNAKYDYLEIPQDEKNLYSSQDQKYGFNLCETTNLDYTACVWLYSHIKMMLDVSKKVYGYEDPVSDDTSKELQDIGVDTSVYCTQKLLFEYICSLIEKADELASNLNIDTVNRANEVEELRKKALMIFAIIHSYAWW